MSPSATPRAHHGPEYQHWQPVIDHDDHDSLRFAINGNKMVEPWNEWDDRTTSHVRELLETSFDYERADGKKAPLKFGGDTWMLALNALLYRNEVDSFILWIESLPEWDNTPRLDTWILNSFEVNLRRPLAEWASRYILLGAITRAYRPGAKLDETPMLIGRGGIGKSTSLRMLLPAFANDWFSDALNLAGDSKQRAEALLGRVIVEAAELAGATKQRSTVTSVAQTPKIDSQPVQDGLLWSRRRHGVTHRKPPR